MSTLNNTVIWIGTGIILISFIVALCIPKKSKVYMKGFFICPLIGLLVSANSISSRFFLLYAIEKNFFIQGILHLGDLSFWGLFFFMLLNDKKEFRKIKILLISTLLISIYLLYFNSNDNPNLHIHALSNLCKTIFCVLYFNKLFKSLPDQNILLEPSFWIVTGLIFYSSLSLPFYALNSYIRQQFVPVIASNIFSISNMFIIIMHLFFIKAYLCTIRLHKA